MAPNALLLDFPLDHKTNLLEQLEEAKEEIKTATFLGKAPYPKKRKRPNVIVINLSGGEILSEDLSMKTATEQAYFYRDWLTEIVGAQNSILIAATGNDALDLDLLCSSRRQPVCLQSSKRVLEDMILRVGSIGYYKRGIIPKLSSFSNYGPNHTEILAPGEGITAMLPSGKVVVSSGTSPAAAIVSGAVTLMTSCRPNAHAFEIKRALLDSADRYEALESKVKEGRVLNIFKTIKTFCLRSPSVTSRKHRDSKKDKSDPHTSDL